MIEVEKKPRLAVVGAGAIGGVLAWSLARAGFAPTLIARGDSARVIARDGLVLERDGVRETMRLNVVEDSAAVGQQDIVFGTMKAHDWPDSVETLLPLIGPDTALIPAINGLPWWYLADSASDRPSCVDPAGILAARIHPENLIGCVVYMGAVRTEPGSIKWSSGRKLVLGEVVPRSTKRLVEIATVLRGAGLEIVETDEIRKEVWIKLLGNAVFNPLSVVARATMNEMIEDTDLRPICLMAMAELIAVAASAGITLPVTPEERLAMNAYMRNFRTSTLQDFEAGRPLELATLIDAPCEIAARNGIPTPVLSTLGRLTARSVLMRHSGRNS